MKQIRLVGSLILGSALFAACGPGAVPGALPDAASDDAASAYDATSADSSTSSQGDGGVVHASDAASDGTTTDGTVSNGPDASHGGSDGGAGDAVVSADSGNLDAASDAAGMPDSSTCSNACDLGASVCGDAGVVSCQVADGGCTAWVPGSACGEHQACVAESDGGAACSCVATACAGNGTACEPGSSNTLLTCATDTNGCVFVSDAGACTPAGYLCSGSAPNAACSATCTSTCTLGQQSCVGSEIVVCEDAGNGCLAYGAATACGDTYQTCTGASGSASCTCKADPYCTSGKSVCSGNSQVDCAEDPTGHCWYATTTAPCVNGACYVDAGSGVCCVNECTNNATQCAGGGQETCTVQANGCTAWGAATSCLPGTCDTLVGKCEGSCVYEATRCTSNGMQSCSIAGAWDDAGACPDVDGGIAACNGGGTACTVSCPTNWSFCGSDSYCSNLQSDDNNCGECGRVCPNPGTCTAGACVFTYGYTGSAATGSVPTGYTEMVAVVAGGAGGNTGIPSDGGVGGLGGTVTATFAVNASTGPLAIYVGGLGVVGAFDVNPPDGGGFNGGGGGASYDENASGEPSLLTGAAGGGGASDIRLGGSTLADRAIVAGGGGGAGGAGYGGAGNNGGAGGTTTAATTASNGQGGSAGSGGSATAGGANGCAAIDDPSTSGLGVGAYGFDNFAPALPGAYADPPGGGGGGGYYGGGAGCWNGTTNGSGGGGGSSYVIPGTTSVTMTAGTRSGNGQITLTFH